MEVISLARYMRKSEMATHVKNARDRIAKVNPSVEEFLAITVLMFFTYGKQQRRQFYVAFIHFEYPYPFLVDHSVRLIIYI